MRRLVIILTLCVGCIITAGAQSTFTQRLQQSNQGEGKVTVKQSKEIDNLVNGTSNNTISSPTVNRKQQEKEKTNDQATAKEVKPLKAPSEKLDSTIVSDSTANNQKKVMKGYKISGYRVQVFAGGNSRSDRIKAEKTGSEIKSLFPGVPVYVHFYSPRWVCRMGNYRSYEEAHEVLNRVKNLGYQSAIIVKGKITVQYQ
ncbi:MAG: SPOR domain-containing protein [Prevotella sp.]|nr:SPOR domain-containing protein [Prevotella sp.]